MEQEKVWESIAVRWQEFRDKPINEVINFIKNKEGKILDLGCGSGRNFTKTKATIYAVDFSQEMLKYAREHAKKLKIKAKFKRAEANNLPFKNNFFDAAMVIAVLHCINGKKREKTIKELYRVLKPKAKALILVWSRNNQRIKNKPKECFIPWTIDGKKYQRYTYIYDKNEIKQLLENIGFKIKEISEDENITVIVEK